MPDVLLAQRHRVPEALVGSLEKLCEISRNLRQYRELAFCGAEDLTPSGFYSRNDAREARRGAQRRVELVQPHIA